MNLWTICPALFSCWLVACQASIPEQRPADNSGDIEDDIATAESRPEVCLTILVDAKRRVLRCPKGEAYDMATQRCVVPIQRSAPPDLSKLPPVGFTDRLKELEACKQGVWKQSGAWSHGLCADGKRFFENNGFLSGGTEVYRGERRVGVSTWTDYGGGSTDGDTGCVVVERVGLCGTPLHLFRRTVLP